MARYGVNVLLTKYNNPISRSARILINSKSYYHPYAFSYSGEVYDQEDGLILSNTTAIGNAEFEAYRCTYYLEYVYKTKDYSISFSRKSRGVLSIYLTISLGEEESLYDWCMEKGPLDSKFKVSVWMPDFVTIANIITETTISEIYKNHLAAISAMVQLYMPYYERRWKDRYTHVEVDCICIDCV